MENILSDNKKLNQAIVLESNRLAFPNINIKHFQHPFDLKASQNIDKIPAIKEIYKAILKFLSDDITELHKLIGSIKVTENQFPKLYSIFKEARNILDMNHLQIDLYLNSEPYINASAMGFKKYFVTIYRGLVDALDEEELLFVIAHELSHIKFEHMLYLNLTLFISNILLRMLPYYLPYPNYPSYPNYPNYPNYQTYSAYSNHQSPQNHPPSPNYSQDVKN